MSSNYPPPPGWSGGGQEEGGGGGQGSSGAFGSDPAQPAGPPTRTGPPDWLIFGAGLLLVGGIAEGLYRISRNAAYLFVALVILGYAAISNRLDQAIAFLRNLGIIVQRS